MSYININKKNFLSEFTEGRKNYKYILFYLSFLLSLLYAIFILYLNSYDKFVFYEWIAFTKPFFAPLTQYAPGVQSRLATVASLGYGDRIPLLNHLYVAAALFGAISGSLLVFSEYSNKCFINDVLRNTTVRMLFFRVILALMFFYSSIMILSIGRSAIPDTRFSVTYLTAGYQDNFKAMFEYTMYFLFYLMIAASSLGVVYWLYRMINDK